MRAPSMPQPASIVGDVLERNVSSSSSKSVSSPRPPDAANKSGFPSVHHRSKSAFAKARDARQNGTNGQRLDSHSKSKDVPVVRPTVAETRNRSPKRASTSASASVTSDGVESADWRRQMSQENERKVQAMTDEEREQERAELLERFGSGIDDLLKKVKENRDGELKRPRESSSARLPQHSRPQSPTSAHASILRSNSPPCSRSSTPRPNRMLRFADITPNDVHVYESQPPSPRRPLLLLPPPADDDKNKDTIPTIKLTMKNPPRMKPEINNVDEPPKADITKKQQIGNQNEPEEGTPEDIRRRFFPHIPPNDPSLEWIEKPLDDASSSAESIIPRFDLSGCIVPISQRSTLPTHLGLHHHSNGSIAGYTLDDLFLLSRSTVPAQRATMMGVLSRILKGIVEGRFEGVGEEAEGLKGKEEEIRKRALGAGLEAMDQRGGVGLMAVELVWVCIVVWDEKAVMDFHDVELRTPKKRDSAVQPPSELENAAKQQSNNEQDIATSPGDPIDNLPLDHILPQISRHFSLGALPPESLVQLLSIVHRLARHSNSIALQILKTPDFLRNVMNAFLLTRIPPMDSSPLPVPLALTFLRTLGLASRENAQALVEPCDALLRFVTTLPTDSSYEFPLATTLLTQTLELYATLASYGLYAHVATTAASHFSALHTYIFSKSNNGEAPRSRALKNTWLRLFESWMVCARDPHRTSPPHDLLWSQIIGWGWGEGLVDARESLATASPVDDDLEMDVWSRLWGASAAYLEGSRVNAVRGGEGERKMVIENVRDGFQGGIEHEVVRRAVNTLEEALKSKMQGASNLPGLIPWKDLAASANCLRSALQFSFACMRLNNDDCEPAPWTEGLMDSIRKTVEGLLTHEMWSITLCDTKNPRWCSYLRPVTALLHSYLRMLCVLPGTDMGKWLSLALISLQRFLPGDEEFARWVLDQIMQLMAPETSSTSSQGSSSQIVLIRKDIINLAPFVSYLVHSKEDVYVGSVTPSPESIQKSTTQRLAADCLVRRTGEFGLPLTRDWSTCALDHLLKSGTSPVFSSLPSSWDASETDLVRASLLFTKEVRDVLMTSGRGSYAMSREQTILACMKVFMLEHGQQDQNGSDVEVFRDRMVERLMEDLLLPFTLSSSNVIRNGQLPKESLEDAAKSFLSSSTPFYQFYTDFIALYDAISFSHPIFNLLLLPPTSMKYPIDYRKHLYGDFGHVLRNLRAPPNRVICDDVRDYLWPIEKDVEMIGWYLRALVKWQTLDEFVRFVAVHHVACNIWPDLREGEGLEAEGPTKDRPGLLLRAVFDQGRIEVVRDVVRYKQNHANLPARTPPACFEAPDGEWKKSRLECIEKWGGATLRDRLQGILM